MARYASGKKSQAISDISGAKVPYTQLKTTWNNLRVEPSEFDPKHPQLTPAKNVIDATALYDPRPSTDVENVVIDFAFTSNIFLSRVERSQIGTNIHAKGNVGTVSFLIEEGQTGVARCNRCDWIGSRRCWCIWSCRYNCYWYLFTTRPNRCRVQVKLQVQLL